VSGSPLSSCTRLFNDVSPFSLFQGRLHYYHDLPTAEIAKILEISEGTVHSRLHTARGRIRAELQRKNFD
ncbi:MAG: RNA polymerase sigma factor, partial [Anaerolineales bacterium]